MSKQPALRSAVRSVAFSCRTRHAIVRHGRVTGPSPTYPSNVPTHRKKGAPPWKSDSSYAMRCARGHVKIQSELSSRSVCVVCYREISRPEWLQTTRSVSADSRGTHRSSLIGRRAASLLRRPINELDGDAVFSCRSCKFTMRQQVRCDFARFDIAIWQEAARLCLNPTHAIILF